MRPINPETPVDDLNKRIASEINRLREGDFGEIILDDEPIENAPPLEMFLEPPPDVMVGSTPGGEGAGIDDWMERHPNVLGTYSPMRSPGRVVLIGGNLEGFYWSLVRVASRGMQFLTKLDLHGAWALVRSKTHEHELFHYNMNVFRELFGGPYQPDLEESLAVASARLKILGHRATWNSQIGRMNGLFYSRIMEAAFRYRSAGYRDWVLYADEARFQ